jgi:hypothetical protein
MEITVSKLAEIQKAELVPDKVRYVYLSYCFQYGSGAYSAFCAVRTLWGGLTGGIK